MLRTLKGNYNNSMSALVVQCPDEGNTYTVGPIVIILDIPPAFVTALYQLILCVSDLTLFHITTGLCEHNFMLTM